MVGSHVCVESKKLTVEVHNFGLAAGDGDGSGMSHPD